MDEPKAMREIHEIRERMSKETRNMTIEQRVAYFSSGRKEWEKFGIKIIDKLPERAPVIASRQTKTDKRSNLTRTGTKN